MTYDELEFIRQTKDQSGDVENGIDEHENQSEDREDNDSVSRVESADFAFRGNRRLVGGASIVSIRSACTNQHTNQGNLNTSSRMNLRRWQLITTDQNNHIDDSRQRADEAKTDDASSRSRVRRVLRWTRQRRSVVCGDGRRRCCVLRCCSPFIGQVHLLSIFVDVASNDLATMKASDYSITLDLCFEVEGSS